MKNYHAPDEKGFFGEHGGLYVSETLIPALKELEQAYNEAKNDPEFWAEFRRDLKHYVGRPSPVYHAARLSEHLGGAQIWLKREDLNHTGAHKVNNTIGQALLARRMGKTRHRRNRRGSARRGFCHRRRTFRHDLRRVHGCGRYSTPNAECVPYEAAWCECHRR